MIIKVNPHKVNIVREQTEPINEKEIKVSNCQFEFDEKITDNFVKEAYFTLNGETYKQIIVNNECDYPSEVLTQKGTLEIGVVAYLVENEEEIVRYNPSPDYYDTWVGSLKNAENSEPITPTDKEQIEQAIVNLEVNKQDKLIAGENISIENNTISATDTIYDDTEIKETISEIERDVSDLSDSVDNKVDKVSGKGLSTNDYTTDEKNKLAGLSNYDDTEVKSSISNLQTNKADRTEIPTKTSDLTNDSGFITNLANDLVNYYLKDDTYTKEQVNDLISAISTMDLRVVEQLPTQDISTTTIYLVPKVTPKTNDVYDEYIYVSNDWEHIGSTEVDLTDYVKNTDYATSSKGGVIKSDGNGFGVSTVSGLPYVNTYGYANYSSASNSLFIGKGTLENVIAGKNLVSASDYATDQKGGTLVSGGNAQFFVSNTTGKAYAGVIPYSGYSSLVNQTFISKGTLENVIAGKGLVSQTEFENSQAVQDNAINNINNELDAFFKKTVSGTEIYLKQTLNWKLKLKINGNTGGVTGNNTINILSKNVYNKNTPTEHIYYDDTGNPQVDNTRDFINIDIPVFDKFVISYGGKFGGASFIRVIQYDDNNNFVKRSLISTNNQAITTESNTARILVSVNAGSSDYFTNLQIERGEIPTTYADYQSQSYPINLGNIVLNENDYIYKDNGNWYTKISGTDTQITDDNLIEQLNTMNNNTTSFEGATYIYSDYASSPIYFNADVYISMTPDLTDYVKNTDFAQNSSIMGGVVRYANGVYGIRNVQNGYIGIVKPTDAEIEAQSNGWRVLTPAQLSKAVKEGVTNNSITLTSAEKEVARNWLGLERSWKKIRTVTIPSDDYKGQTIDGVFYNYEGENGIKNFSFHTDSDGNSLEGKGITGYVLRVTPTTNINVNQAFIGVVGNSMIIYTTNIKNTTSVFWYEFGIGPTFVGKTNNNPGQYQMGNRMNLGKELTSFIFNGFEATSVLGEGSKFEIWAYGYWD